MNTSKLLYDTIIGQSKHAKRRKAINNIKKACDLLYDQGTTITVGRIGKLCASWDGGPKPQSIRNAPELIKYIGARQAEQQPTITPGVLVTPATAALDDKTLASLKLVEAERDVYKSKFLQLKRLIEHSGVNNYEDFVKTGKLSPMTSINTAAAGVNQVIKRLLDPATLRKGNLAVVNNRLICTISNEIILSADDLQILVNTVN